MDTYYDRLNDFFRRLESEPLPCAEQLAFLHLLHINNRTQNGGQFYCTDERLCQLSQLKKSAVTQAKRNLKNRGLIDFKTNKRAPRAGTLYILPPLIKKITTPAISPAVQKAWNDAGGTPINALGFEFVALQDTYGEAALLEAIQTAARANKFPYLSFNFVRAILEKKGAPANASAPGDNPQRYDDLFKQKPDDKYYNHIEN